MCVCTHGEGGREAGKQIQEKKDSVAARSKGLLLWGSQWSINPDAAGLGARRNIASSVLSLPYYSWNEVFGICVCGFLLLLVFWFVFSRPCFRLCFPGHGQLLNLLCMYLA